MKTFLLDTNVLLHDPTALKVFDDNEVIIPISVLDELDDIKIRMDEVGRNARLVTRMLDDLRSLGSLSNGVKLGESLIKIELNCSDNVPTGLSRDKVDNKILSVAITLTNEGKNVIVVSKDINLRVKCDVCGIKAQDYNKDKVAEKVDSIYGGVQKIFIDSKKIDELYYNGSVNLDITAFPNEFIIMKSNSCESQSVIGRHIKDGLIKLLKIPKSISNIIPRNAEQRMAIDLLLDPKINLVTLIGFAGCGKTLISVASALHQVLDNSKLYDRLLISRPIQPMGKDIGFLPGTISEKLMPWMKPLYDSLEYLLGQNYDTIGLESLVQVEPLTYIRGRSIPKSFMILDEAQNLTQAEVKTIITRMGENSKIVLCGDIQQIDNIHIDFSNNAITQVIEKFKEYSIAGHITLRKGERSELANLAAKIL